MNHLQDQAGRLRLALRGVFAKLLHADEVLRAVRRRPGVRYPVLVPNLRGLERALAAGADSVAVFTAASDAFTRANISMTIAKRSWPWFSEVRSVENFSGSIGKISAAV